MKRWPAARRLTSKRRPALFFLLIGRYLDRLTRSRALSAAQDLLLLQSHAATVVGPDGVARAVPSHALRPRDILLIARGERAGADGIVMEGVSSLDTATLTGESLPRAVAPGQEVPAGAVNLDGAASPSGDRGGRGVDSGRMAALAEAAAQTRNRYTRIADRAARFYAPAVHTLALLTLTFWWAHTGDFHAALTNAVAVLIVTCPCALALAVPAVQVAAASALLRAGISPQKPRGAGEAGGHRHGPLRQDRNPDARRFRPQKAHQTPDFCTPRRAWQLLSTHPLSRALVRAAGQSAPAQRSVKSPARDWKLATEPVWDRRFSAARPRTAHRPRTAFCGIARRTRDCTASFSRTRSVLDARRTVAAFAERGLDVILLSGDRPGPGGRAGAPHRN